MFKKKINNKGFTLIELLAVIVILGVLMIIAIPMVSQYIKQSRQDAFVDTAKAYVEAAKLAYMNGDLTEAVNELKTTGSGPTGLRYADCEFLDSFDATSNRGAGNGSSYHWNDGVVYILFRYVRVDKTGGKSSFGKAIDRNNSYVKIRIEDNGSYTYSVYMIDAGGNRIEETKVEDLTRNSVIDKKENGSKYDPYNSCKGDYDNPS